MEEQRSDRLTAVACAAIQHLYPEELTQLARRLLDAGDGQTALALQDLSERRMAAMLGPGESLRRRG